MVSRVLAVEDVEHVGALVEGERAGDALHVWPGGIHVLHTREDVGGNSYSGQAGLLARLALNRSGDRRRGCCIRTLTCEWLNMFLDPCPP